MPTKGDTVIDFIETFLSLGGSYYGEPWEVLPFQKDIIRDIYKTCLLYTSDAADE